MLESTIMSSVPSLFLSHQHKTALSDWICDIHLWKSLMRRHSCLWTWYSFLDFIDSNFNFRKNNWLGEVGGVAGLIYLLYVTLMKITLTILLKHPKTSQSGFSKAETEEIFHNLN